MEDGIDSKKPLHVKTIVSALSMANVSSKLFPLWFEEVE
jgi:hypothetical protein